jgi:glycosyltransferase involved in cell wall biosynthesis
LSLPVVSEFRTNFHTYSAHYGFGILSKWVLGYLRRFHNRCAVTMVPTPGLFRDLQASGFERLRVVARGVDADRFHPFRRCPSLRTSWGAGPHTPVVISVGRLAPEKNLDLLVSSFQRMRTVRPDVLLVVVGDGPARGWLEERLPGAIFAGRHIGEDLARHYASADLLMFPSLSETFGNVTLEAMSSGLAVLAFDYGAAAQSVRSGIHGWTVPFGDAEAFRRAAADSLGNLGWLRRLGSQAREAAEGLSWSEIVQTVSTIYRGVAAPSRHPAGTGMLLSRPDLIR